MVTQTKVIEWYQHYKGNIGVSYSGGKDSTVLLNLVRRIYPETPAVFVNTGMEYPEIIAFVKATENVTWLKPDMLFKKVLDEFGYPVISKELAHKLDCARKGSLWAVMAMQGLMRDGTPSFYNQRNIKYQYLLQAPFKISDKCCDVMKKKPLDRYKKETGTGIIVGTLASDSFRRQTAYLKTGCNAFHLGKSQPMAFWTEQDVLQYLRDFHIPYAPIYGDITENEKGRLVTTGVQRTGCMFCMFGAHREKAPNRFQKMRQTHPRHYDYCINTLGCGEVLDFLNVNYKN